MNILLLEQKILFGIHIWEFSSDFISFNRQTALYSEHF